MKKTIQILLIGACVFFNGFALAEEGHHDHHDHEGHVHVAPHGGALVVLGDHLAHLEIVLDDQTGVLIAYALDDCAEESIRIAQPEIEMTIGVHHDEKHEAHEEEMFTVNLKAIDNLLTGETVGDTSEFMGESEKLIGVHDFEAVLKYIKIRGQELSNVEFHFPEGGE